MKRKSPNGLSVMVDASTGHLSQADMHLLEREAMSNVDSEFPRVVFHEYGWIVFLPEEINSCIKEKAGEGLLALIKLGVENKAILLNLDCDAGQIDGICVPS